MSILKNDFRTLCRIILYSMWNFVILMIGIIIRRDNRIVLFGAWMGTKFADNSRYLFQYLNMNKNNLGLKRIIWVTRNPKVLSALQEMGYEVYMIGSWDSFYWHLKSGYHIICNMPANSGRFKADIDTKYSAGATKIQLWHGVGIKAVGATSNATTINNSSHSKTIINFANTYVARKLGTLGCWGEAYYLCTSDKNMEINLKNSLSHKRSMFISCYPRHCKCLEFTPEEKKALEIIKEHKRTILFLPTFRDEISNYKQPLEDERIRSFIVNNDLLWIEKPHPASKGIAFQNDNLNDNTLVLDAEFDINVLLRNIDIVITDYSSVAFDAINLLIPVVLYAPDIEEYQYSSNGLLYDLREFCPELLSLDLGEMQIMITEALDGAKYIEKRKKTYNWINNLFFDNREADYSEIWSDIKMLNNRRTQ